VVLLEFFILPTVSLLESLKAISFFFFNRPCDIVFSVAKPQGTMRTIVITFCTHVNVFKISRAGIHSQIFVVLLLVLCSCYSQLHLAIGVWCCYGFLTPDAIFLWGEGCLFGNSSILFYLKDFIDYHQLLI
jgi:hypothetical protein